MVDYITGLQLFEETSNLTLRYVVYESEGIMLQCSYFKARNL